MNYRNDEDRVYLQYDNVASVIGGTWPLGKQRVCSFGCLLLLVHSLYDLKKLSYLYVTVV